MFVTIFLILSAVIAIYLYLIWNNNYWKNRGVVSDKPALLTGSFPGSFSQKIAIAYEIDKIYKKYRDQSPFVGIYSGRKPQLMLLDPKLIKDVLVTNFQHFNANEFGTMINKEIDPMFARNPFMLSGHEWKEKRAEIAPAFSSAKIRSMFPLIEDVCNKMTTFINKEIEKNVPQDGFDAKELAARFTTDVVSSCIYNVDSKAFTADNSEIREMGSSLFGSSSWVIFYYFMLLPVFPFITKIYQIPFVTKTVESFFTNLTKDAIKMRETSKIERDDFLQYLLQLRQKKNLSEIDVAAHTITFFLDGYETSSNVIAHILYYLAANKDVQSKLRSEIYETLRAQGGKINFDSLNDMEYLDQVLNETLRINPTVAHITKMCTTETEFTDFKDKKVKIEKDTVIMLPILSIQNDPEHYEHPEIFYPERFSPANGGVKKYKDNGVFLPFGDGPRTCLGMKFGTTQSKAAIFQIINDFEVTVNKRTNEPFVLDPANFMSMPIGGIWLNLNAIRD